MAIGTSLSMEHYGESQICELLCISCLIVSAKNSEPKSLLLTDLDENFSFEELQRMELFVLDTISWNASRTTPYDYILFWAHQGNTISNSKLDWTRHLCVQAMSKCTPGAASLICVLVDRDVVLQSLNSLDYKQTCLGWLCFSGLSMSRGCQWRSLRRS